MARNLIRELLIAMPNNRFIWFFLKPFAKLGYVWWTARDRKLQYEASLRSQEVFKQRFFPLFKELTVMHGPFQGTRYPSQSAAGSSLFAKLLGSYEREIQPAVECFCANDYSEIINIGCGEGYYAIGLARRIHNAKVYAYDIEPSARALCQEMAAYNGVDKQVNIKPRISAAELQTFSFTKRGLIICDCEGFEKQLFVPANIHNLRNVDLIIETHDFIDLEISYYLTALFEQTHEISVVKSIDDIQKVKEYQYEEIADYDINDRKFLLHEGRPAIMEWLVCKARF